MEKFTLTASLCRYKNNFSFFFVLFPPFFAAREYKRGLKRGQGKEEGRNGGTQPADKSGLSYLKGNKTVFLNNCWDLHCKRTHFSHRTCLMESFRQHRCRGHFALCSSISSRRLKRSINNKRPISGVTFQGTAQNKFKVMYGTRGWLRRKVFAESIWWTTKYCEQICLLPTGSRVHNSMGWRPQTRASRPSCPQRSHCPRGLRQSRARTRSRRRCRQQPPPLPPLPPPKPSSEPW